SAVAPEHRTSAMKGLEESLDLARERKVWIPPVAQEKIELVVHLLGGADPPDAIARVVRDEQRAIAGHGHAHGSSPLVDRRLVGSVARQKAGEEIFDWPRLSSRHRKKHDLVARCHGSIPGAVQRDESAVAVFLRKLRACI